jgi:hypothetical protein
LTVHAELAKHFSRLLINDGDRGDLAHFEVQRSIALTQVEELAFPLLNRAGHALLNRCV